MAVLLVIANHLFGWPAGGFVGVDVFFVLSGFLITGLLLREHERTGRISLKEFYARRARRILPAALTVSAVTVAVAFVMFTLSRFQSILTDSIWATLFGANWRMILTGTNYMNATAAVSPLQHYWSLSIEEQFYFIWPLALVLVLAAAARRPRRAAAIVIGAVTFASFAWAMLETSTQPTWAYFSTLSRVWELGAGALVAVLSTRLSIPDALRPFVAWMGLAAIAIGAAFLTKDSPFPGPFALVPVIGTCAVIVAGLGGRQRFLLPLTNRVLGYIGDISYSLYLWHFPVIVFVGVFLEATPRRFAVMALIVTFALSVISYHFIENPIRHKGAKSKVLKPGLAIAGILAVSVATTATVPAPSAVIVQVAATEHPDTPAGDALRGIDEALALTEWPTLSPAIDSIGPADLAPEWVEDGCLGSDDSLIPNPIKNADHCHFGSGEKLAVVFGDSVAISWVPGIRAALSAQGYRIDVLTLRGCPAAAVDVIPIDGPSAECAEFRTWALGEIAALKPDLVIESSSAWSITRLSSRNEGAAAVAEWTDGSRRTLEALAKSSGSVALLQSPPMGSAGEGFSACAVRGSSPANCLLYIGPFADQVDSADEAASSGLSVKYVRTREWFCSTAGFCPSFVGETPVLVDGVHLSARRSMELSPLLSSVLTAP